MKLWDDYKAIVNKYPGPALMIMSMMLFFTSIGILNAYLTDTIQYDFMVPYAIPYAIFDFCFGVLCLALSFKYINKEGAES